MLPLRKPPAETPRLKVHRGKKVQVHRASETILDRLGWKGLVAVVWRSTPFPVRLIALPYGLAIYARFLAACQTIEEVRALHVRKCRSSRLFRALRPRFRLAKYLLV